MRQLIVGHIAEHSAGFKVIKQN